MRRKAWCYGRDAVAAQSDFASRFTPYAVQSPREHGAHSLDRLRLWLYGVPGEWTLLVCALMGAAAPGFTFAWSLCKEVNPPQHAGMAISVANSGGFLAAGILQPLAGAVLDWRKAGAAIGTFEDFRIAMASLAVFAVLGFAGSLFVREMYCRNIWGKLEGIEGKEEKEEKS